MRLHKDLISRLNNCISQSDKPESVAGHIFREFKIHELQSVLEHLVQVYTDAPNLLNTFCQSKSDACSIETSEFDKLDNDFKTWYFAKYLNQ